jgi:hypothetical protein
MPNGFLALRAVVFSSMGVFFELPTILLAKRATFFRFGEAFTSLRQKLGTLFVEKDLRDRLITEDCS